MTIEMPELIPHVVTAYVPSDDADLVGALNVGTDRYGRTIVRDSIQAASHVEAQGKLTRRLLPLGVTICEIHSRCMAH
jgi:hypothetical protein